MKKRCTICNKKIGAGESAYIDQAGEVFRVCLDCQQKYERKRRNAENMLYFMPLLVFIFISNIKCLLSSDFELFGLNSQSLCKIEAILLLFLFMCAIRNYLSKDLMKNMSEEISAEKEREEENEKK